MKGMLITLLLLLSADAFGYTRQDSLRGGNGRGRDWWDVVRYDLVVEIDTATQTIQGRNTITFRIVDAPRDSMQIDLQDSFRLTSAKSNGKEILFSREGNVYWLKTPDDWLGRPKEMWHFVIADIDLSFEGKPRVAVNPPWDGGFIWTKDSMGKPWIAVACQGLGASSWWPCKDYQGDEPDSGMVMRVSYGNDKLANYDFIGNGRVNHAHSERDTMFELNKKGDTTKMIIRGKDLAAVATVRNPINTYNTTFYIGDYAHWHDTLHGEKGVLDLDFYPLRYNEAKARKQWAQVKEMLRCFEWWMGPYPFYEDGYKLVEAPYLGMEHQSAIAYGNGYKNGYLSRSRESNWDSSIPVHIDRSGTGVGFSFDFIIVHESGHEWFGNSITARDIADNWLHEGFTTYTETLFAEWIKGKDSAFAYATGEWKNIRNDRPVIGNYGVNSEGSSDMYDKGAAVVHMIRMMINNDSAFRQLLRGLNRDFYHKIVTSKEVEEYIGRFVGRDLRVFFDVYLRSTTIPTLRVTIEKYRRKNFQSQEWIGVPDGFLAPIKSGGHISVEQKYKRMRDDYIISYPSKGYGIKAVGLYKVEEVQHEH